MYIVCGSFCIDCAEINLPIMPPRVILLDCFMLFMIAINFLMNISWYLLKACDIVNHDMLFTKLDHTGILVTLVLVSMGKLLYTHCLQ